MNSLAILVIVCGLTLSCAFKDAQGLAETKSSSFHRMKRASMESHWDAMIPRGARPQTKCEKKREEARQLVQQGMVGVFVPQCTADGAYEAMQCWGSIGSCWCVYKNGKIIPGTSRGPTEEPPTCKKNA